VLFGAVLEIAGLVPPPWAGSLFGTPGEEEIVLEVRRSEPPWAGSLFGTPGEEEIVLEVRRSEMSVFRWN